LLLPGLVPAVVPDLTAQIGALGFIVDAGDPRCRVIACAGSPVCASGQFPSRALAPAIAQSAGRMLSGRDVIHVSGCSKGCAHPAPAAFAVFGRDGICDIQVNGTWSHSVTVDDLPTRIAHVVQAYREPERG
jgi:precorrin-3B synthase